MRSVSDIFNDAFALDCCQFLAAGVEFIGDDLMADCNAPCHVPRSARCTLSMARVFNAMEENGMNVRVVDVPLKGKVVSQTSVPQESIIDCPRAEQSRHHAAGDSVFDGITVADQERPAADEIGDSDAKLWRVEVFEPDLSQTLAQVGDCSIASEDTSAAKVGDDARNPQEESPVKKGTGQSPGGDESDQFIAAIADSIQETGDGSCRRSSDFFWLPRTIANLRQESAVRVVSAETGAKAESYAGAIHAFSRRMFAPSSMSFSSMCS